MGGKNRDPSPSHLYDEIALLSVTIKALCCSATKIQILSCVENQTRLN